MKAYFIRNTDTGKFIAGSHSATILCYASKVAADAEIDYLNNKAPTANFSNTFVVVEKTIE